MSKLKIYIVGAVASGKTTLAKNLSKQLHIPYFELDCIVHVETKAGRIKQTDAEQVAEISRIDKGGDWIIEGTYRISCHCLFDMADKIIFLDTPLHLRKLRICTRFIRQQLRIEPSHYKSDFKMLGMMFKWTRDFENNRKEFETMLNNYKNKVAYVKTSKLKQSYIKIEH